MVEVGKKGKVKRVRLFLMLAALVITALLIGVWVLIGGRQKPVIKLYDGQWRSLSINNAITEFIIEEGYGYPVETVVTTDQMMKEDIQKGNLNLNMEMWQQNFFDWYNEQIENGNIVNLGMIYEDGPQFFIIPKWVAEQYNIKTIFDMKDHWKLFMDPEDPTKGMFYNGMIGWACYDINVVKLEAYGLTRYYNIVTPGSSEGLEVVLAMAQQNHRPVFGYYWAPAALMGDYNWHILEEPPYTDECWKDIMTAVEDESLRPIDRACAYATFPIDKIAHKNLLKKAPDVVEMLRKMVVGLEPLNRTLAWAKENEVQQYEKAAVYYLQNYEDRWKSWVALDAYEKIKRALEEASR